MASASPAKPKDALEKRKLGELVVVVIRARHLTNVKIAKQDPYSKLTIDSSSRRTSAIKKGGQHPEWDEQLNFDIYEDLEDTLARQAEEATAVASSSDGKTTGDGGVRKKKVWEKGVKNMRVACYADAPKEPELIGEAVFDLAKALNSGEDEDWIHIFRKDRYAGEIFLELTYFIAGKPPPPKPPKLPSSASNYGGPGSFVSSSPSFVSASPSRNTMRPATNANSSVVANLQAQSLYIPPYGPGAKAGGIGSASAMGGQGEMHRHRRDSLPSHHSQTPLPQSGSFYYPPPSSSLSTSTLNNFSRTPQPQHDPSIPRPASMMSLSSSVSSQSIPPTHTPSPAEQYAAQHNPHPQHPQQQQHHPQQQQHLRHDSGGSLQTSSASGYVPWQHGAPPPQPAQQAIQQPVPQHQYATQQENLAYQQHPAPPQSAPPTTAGYQQQHTPTSSVYGYPSQQPDYNGQPPLADYAYASQAGGHPPPLQHHAHSAPPQVFEITPPTQSHTPMPSHTPHPDHQQYYQQQGPPPQSHTPVPYNNYPPQLQTSYTPSPSTPAPYQPSSTPTPYNPQHNNYDLVPHARQPPVHSNSIDSNGSSGGGGGRPLPDPHAGLNGNSYGGGHASAHEHPHPRGRYGSMPTPYQHQPQQPSSTPNPYAQQQYAPPTSSDGGGGTFYDPQTGQTYYQQAQPPPSHPYPSSTPVPQQPSSTSQWPATQPSYLQQYPTTTTPAPAPPPSSTPDPYAYQPPPPQPQYPYDQPQQQPQQQPQYAPYPPPDRSYASTPAPPIPGQAPLSPLPPPPPPPPGQHRQPSPQPSHQQAQSYQPIYQQAAAAFHHDPYARGQSPVPPPPPPPPPPPTMQQQQPQQQQQQQRWY